MGLQLSPQTNGMRTEYIIKGQPSDTPKDTHMELSVFYSYLTARYLNCEDPEGSLNTCEILSNILPAKDSINPREYRRFRIDDAVMNIEICNFGEGRNMLRCQMNISIEPHHAGLEAEIKKILNDVKEFKIKAK